MKRTAIISTIILMVLILSSCPQAVLTDSLASAYELSQVFPHDPVGEWLFNGDTKDSSGYGNDVTISTNPGVIIPTTDRYGNPDSALEVADPTYAATQVTADMADPGSSSYKVSISFWLYPEWTPPIIEDPAMFGFSTTIGSYEFRVYIENGTGYKFESSGVSDSKLLYIPTHQWQHFTVTWDTGTGSIELYQDGTLKISAHLNLTIVGDTIVFHFPGSQYSGKYDDVRLYYRILSEDEIKALAAE